MKPLRLNGKTILKFPISAKIGITLIFALIFIDITQSQTSKNYYIEIRAASQNSFGPSDKQAEIAGGIDTMSFDRKKHLIPGFKSSNSPVVVVGFRKGNLHFETAVGYYSQDIGLIHKVFDMEYLFAVLEMLSLRFSGLLQFSDRQKRGPYGLYMGFFIRPVFPVTWKLNENSKAEFAMAFHCAPQANWGLDYKYLLRIGKKGGYLSTGATVTMPGIIGSIGKLESLPNSQYTVIRNKIQMFTINAYLGLGFNLGKRN